MIDWDTIATTTTSQTDSAIDFKKMLALMREMKAKGEFLDAMRDVAFEDLRANGSYIKSERDALGEFWVVDDAILKQLEKVTNDKVANNPAIASAMPFYGIRVVPLSQWRNDPHK